MKKLAWFALCCSLTACGGGEIVHEGTLEPSDNKLSSDGTPYDWFKLELEEGDRLVASVEGEGFEPTLFLFTPDHKQITEQPGSQTMAILNYEVRTSGSYAVMVNAMERDTNGAYTLTLRFED